MFVFIEIICWAATIALAVLWVSDPKGDWEPWAFLVSVVASLIFDLIRRRRDGQEIRNLDPLTTRSASKERSSVIDVLDRIHDVPVSQSLAHALRIAKHSGNDPLEKWCRLELYGYTAEGGMAETDSVPEYRGVSGRWFDSFGEHLDLSEYPDLSIVNSFRLRFGAKMLEDLAAESTVRSIADDQSSNLLRKHTGFNAVRFSFSPTAVRGVLDTIKNRLAEKLADAVSIADDQPQSAEHTPRHLRSDNN